MAPRWLKHEDYGFYYDRLTQYVHKEHELLSQRMAWLVSANAFLFAPVALTLQTKQLSAMQWLFLVVISLLGLVFGLCTGVPICQAVATMRLLRKRQQTFLDTIGTSAAKFKLVDQDQDVKDLNLPARTSFTHESGMIFQLFIPGTLVVIWAAACFFSVINFVGEMAAIPQ